MNAAEDGNIKVIKTLIKGWEENLIRRMLERTDHEEIFRKPPKDST